MASPSWHVMEYRRTHSTSCCKWSRRMGNISTACSPRLEVESSSTSDSSQTNYIFQRCLPHLLSKLDTYQQTSVTELALPPKMSGIFKITQRAALQASRATPTTARGAASSTSSLPMHQYASQSLRKLARQQREAAAPADWVAPIQRAASGMPLYVYLGGITRTHILTPRVSDMAPS